MHFFLPRLNTLNTLPGFPGGIATESTGSRKYSEVFSRAPKCSAENGYLNTFQVQLNTFEHFFLSLPARVRERGNLEKCSGVFRCSAGNGGAR